jgi:hypothetical protein
LEGTTSSEILLIIPGLAMIEYIIMFQLLMPMATGRRLWAIVPMRPFKHYLETLLDPGSNQLSYSNPGGRTNCGRGMGRILVNNMTYFATLDGIKRTERSCQV